MRVSYNSWMKTVKHLLWIAEKLRPCDLDYSFRDDYTDGLTPKDSVNSALAEYEEDDEIYHTSTVNFIG